MRDKDRTMKVRVPASTSNLGSGFDVVGLALQMYLEVEATPGTAGTNDIVFDVVHGDDIAEVSLQASLPSEDIGPLEFEAEKAGPKRWVVKDAELAIPGTWDFRVQIRQGEFEAFAETIPITIGTG